MSKVIYDCWVFACRKCGHLLFVDKHKSLKTVYTRECPECGEEPYENWTIIGEGNGKTFEWRR